MAVCTVPGQDALYILELNIIHTVRCTVHVGSTLNDSSVHNNIMGYYPNAQCNEYMLVHVKEHTVSFYMYNRDAIGYDNLGTFSVIIHSNTNKTQGSRYTIQSCLATDTYMLISS